MAVGSFERRNDKYLSLGSFRFLLRKAKNNGRDKRRRKEDGYCENGREREDLEISTGNFSPLAIR